MLLIYTLIILGLPTVIFTAAWCVINGYLTYWHGLAVCVLAAIVAFVVWWKECE